MKSLLKVILAGALAAHTPAMAQPSASGIDFGDDDSDVSDDGECDDSRFTGPGMADVVDDEYDWADATDCRDAFEAGTIKLIEAGDAQDQPNTATPDLRAIPEDLDFGDDTGELANNGECNDNRFVGSGQKDFASVKHDATDCRAAWQNRKIQRKVYFV